MKIAPLNQFVQSVKSNPNLSVAQACQQLVPALEAAAPVSVDWNSQQLKDSAFTRYQDCLETCHSMASGHIPLAAADQPPLAAQIDWKDNVRIACFEMFAAGALEGQQASRQGLAPRSYSLPYQQAAAVPDKLVLTVDEGVAALNQRQRWVLPHADKSRAGEGRLSMENLNQFEKSLNRISMPTPGWINDPQAELITAYEQGANVGILQSEGRLHL